MPIYNITISEDVRHKLLWALETQLEDAADQLTPVDREEFETIQKMLRDSIPGEDNQNDFQA